MHSVRHAQTFTCTLKHRDVQAHKRDVHAPRIKPILMPCKWNASGTKHNSDTMSGARERWLFMLSNKRTHITCGCVHTLFPTRLLSPSATYSTRYSYDVMAEVPAPVFVLCKQVCAVLDFQFNGGFRRQGNNAGTLTYWNRFAAFGQTTGCTVWLLACLRTQRLILNVTAGERKPSAQKKDSRIIAHSWYFLRMALSTAHRPLNKQ